MRRWTTLPLLALVCGAPLLAGCGKPGEREYKAAIRELERNNNVSAKTLLEQAVRRRPGHADTALACNYLGVTCWRLGDLRKAEESFAESRRLDPALAAPAYNLAVLKAQQNDAAAAVPLFEDAARLDPKDSQALDYLGQLYYRKAQYGDALMRWKEALARSPASARLHTCVAIAQLQTEGPEAAVRSLVKALEIDAAYAPALYNLCMIHSARLNQPQEAEAYARQYLKVVRQPDPRAKALQDWIEARERARLPAPPDAAPSGPPRRAPSRDRAETDPLQQARQVASEGRLREACDLCFADAEAARRSGDGGRREAALRLATELAPNEPRAHLALGRFFLDTAQPAEALDRLRRADELAPERAEVQLARAEAEAALGDADTAALRLQQVLNADHGNADARWQLAQLYETRLDLPAEAQREYRAFAELFPEDHRLRGLSERLAALAVRTAPAETPPPPAETAAPPAAAPPALTPPPAAAAIQPAVEEEPAPAEPPAVPVNGRRLPPPETRPRDVRASDVALARGARHLQTRDYEAAVYEFTRAVAMNRESPAAWFHLAGAYRERGDLDFARDAYTRALELAPSDAATRYNLALVLQALDERAAALQQLRYLLAREPDYAPGHYLLGSLLTQDSSRLTEARRHLERFLELAPDDPAAPAVRLWLRP